MAVQTDRLTSFALTILARSPFGRTNAKLEWEVKPLGTSFDGTGTQTSVAWADTGTAGIDINGLVTGLTEGTFYHWRVRILYDPIMMPLQQFSRWFTNPINGWQETKIRTGGSLPNNPPTAVNDSATTNEDTAVTTINVLTNDSDVEGDTITITANTQGANGAVVNNPDGTFTYTLSDGNGGTATATVDVAVSANTGPLSRPCFHLKIINKGFCLRT